MPQPNTLEWVNQLEGAYRQLQEMLGQGDESWEQTGALLCQEWPVHSASELNYRRTGTTSSALQVMGRNAGGCTGRQSESLQVKSSDKLLRCCLNLRRHSHREGAVYQTGTALIPAKGRLSFILLLVVVNAPTFASDQVTSRLQTTAAQESGRLLVMLQSTCMEIGVKADSLCTLHNSACLSTSALLL